MANYNKVMLMGNLTRDPQLSYTPSQTPVVEFGLAVNRKWTGKDGQSKEEICFVECRAFGRQAENINKYLSKGRGVFVEGRLTFGSWTETVEGKERKRSKLTVTVENSQFLPSGGGRGAEGAGGGNYDRSDSSGGGSGAGNPEPQSGADDIPF